MATRTSRPGRTLLICLLAIVAMYAGVAAIGSWKPKLGLDLQGGKRITLQAKSEGGGAVTSSKLSEAQGIIESRVNGAGVSESEVSTQGSDIIVVEIPGTPDADITRSLSQTAQLRFRMVATQLPPAGNQAPTAPGTAPPTTGSSGTSAPPTSGSTAPPRSGSTPSTGESDTAPNVAPRKSDADPSNDATTTSGPNRVIAPWLLDSSDAKAGGAAQDPAPTSATIAPVNAAPTSTTIAPVNQTPTTSAPTTGTDSTGDNTTPPTTALPTEPAPSTDATTTGGLPPALVPPVLENIKDPYAWVAQFRTQSAATTEWLVRLQAYDCKPDPTQPGQIDLPSQPLLACDDAGNRYLLGPSMVDGTDVTDASSGIPQGGAAYAVDLEFNGEGAKKFGEVTGELAKSNVTSPVTGGQLAIVLDGVVLSAPENDDPINGGSAQITGSQADPFTAETASNLANSLKYGALPLSFVIQGNSDEGPELASNQLSAGVLAGIVGLILVLIYCMLYYRGLGIVVVASLVVAGVITYAMVLLLGHAYGFTLTLPGIAGLIVAVGITADSFIVYFERLRDEVRDGRTLRASVETGWVRARSTILAADAVSLLAAVVLFIFAIGVVKGFAFALGLSTVIDVFVVFFFTKPMVTMLSRTKFFGHGHKWSGLDRGHLGMPPLKQTPRVRGGEA